jgi:uncharacterized membrane protein YcgQ (UPF0703/DUF1980 family)
MRNIFLLLAVLSTLSIPACGNKTARTESAEAKKTEASDKPTLEIKEKLFIAQTNEVYLNPEDYMGRRIKLEGLFKTDTYVGNAEPYRFVLRYGPGCCGYHGSAGFEVCWPESHEAAYPSEDDWVEAVGVLDSYEEDGYPYLYIALETLNVLDERGVERVVH